MTEERVLTPKIVGRYALYSEIASGGMASVHLAKVSGDAGFTRVVAVKRLHRNFAEDEAFAKTFEREARVSSRIHHVNVVSVVDVIRDEHELMIVLDYVHGISLAELTNERAKILVPPEIASAICVQTLEGLAAAHQAKDASGAALGLVHRDVSPQNVMVGADGVCRVLDFGIAKSSDQSRATATGVIKGKLAYMAPEILNGQPASVRSDIYGVGVMLWELLVARRLFAGSNEAMVVSKVLIGMVEPPSEVQPSVSPELSAVTMKALSSDPTARFADAQEMLRALSAAMPPAPAHEVARWLAKVMPEELGRRAAALRDVEMAKQAIEVSAVPLPVTAPTQQASRKIPIIAAAFFVLVAVGIVVGLRPSDGRPEKMAESAPSMHVAPSALAITSSATDETPVDPMPSAVSSSAPIESATAHVPAAPIRRGGNRVSGAPSSPSPPSPGASAARADAHPLPSCTPPWNIDPMGRRIYKRECL